jgi:hypothetical protein
VVPPFTWGEVSQGERFALDRFLLVADRMMGRRDLALSEGMRACLAAAYAARWSA